MKFSLKQHQQYKMKRCEIDSVFIYYLIITE